MFDTIAILALVPVFDGLIFPYCKSIGVPVTMLNKMGKEQNNKSMIL